MLDDLDRRILRNLQHEPGIPVGDLAEAAGTTPAVCSRRLARLRDRRIVIGQEAIIDWRRLGYEVLVSLRITLDKAQSNVFDIFIREARKIPEVLEIQTFLGQVDIRLGIIARDMAHYQTLYRSRILTLPHIADIEALVHVAAIKDDETLPL
ncbi:Lrp/AsnC family transcriptional regulator [Tropicimonas sp.]|uniref:Lrp/AsnC family transcriptional regulator n=1 Tax=Tropicimonas sp. TaxID=2067044 RepID=UPI003A897018